MTNGDMEGAYGGYEKVTAVGNITDPLHTKSKSIIVRC